MSVAEQLKALSIRSYLIAKAMESATSLVENPSPRKLKRFLRDFQKVSR